MLEKGMNGTCKTMSNLIILSLEVELLGIGGDK